MKLLAALLIFAGCAFSQPKLPRSAPRFNPLDPCRGRTTVLAFIITTCPHCKAFTAKVMEPMYESGKVCAVAVAFDEGGDIDRFAREQKLRFPLYRIERQHVREFLGMTGSDRAIGTPQVVVMDRLGTIWAQSAPEGSPLLLQPDVIREIVEKLR